FSEYPGSRRSPWFQDLAQRGLGILCGDADHGLYVAVAHAAPFLNQLVIFRNDSDGSINLATLAFDGQVMIILQVSGDLQRGFQQFDVLVQSAKKGFYRACNLYAASHGRFGRSSFRVPPTDETHTSTLERG